MTIPSMDEQISSMAKSVNPGCHPWMEKAHPRMKVTDDRHGRSLCVKSPNAKYENFTFAISDETDPWLYYRSVSILAMTLCLKV